MRINVVDLTGSGKRVYWEGTRYRVAVWRMGAWEEHFIYEGWNFNSGNYLFATDTKQIHVSKFYCPSL